MDELVRRSQEMLRIQREIAAIIAYLERNRKVLDLANERARQKFICLEKQLEEEEEKEREDGANTTTLESLYDISSTLYTINQELIRQEGLAVPDGTSQVAITNS